MADNYFCLDLSESYIKVIDAHKSGNLYEIKYAGFVPSVIHYYSIDIDKIIIEQSNSITKLISSLKINKKNVHVIIPDSVSYSQVIEMPKLNEKELIAAIKYQADQFIPMPLEKITLDIEILAEDKINRKMLVLIVAAPQDIITKIEKTIELSGLVCQSVENELSVIARLMTDIFPPNPQGKIYVIINLGLNSTSLYVFDQKRSLILQVYNFNIGSNLFFKEIQQNLNLDEKKTENLLKEIGFAKTTSYNLEEILVPVISSFTQQIQKFIYSVQDKYKLKVDGCLLLNEAGRIKEIDRKISNLITLPTQNLDIFQFIKNKNSLNAVKDNLSLFIPSLGGNL